MTDPKENKEDGYDLFPNDDDGSEEEDFILKDHDKDDNNDNL